MLSKIESVSFKEALCAYLIKYNAVRELRIVQIAELSFEYSTSDFGIDYFVLNFKIDPIEFVEYADDINLIQENLTNTSKLFLKTNNDSALSHVIVSPKLDGPIAKTMISIEDKKKALQLLNEIKAIMISVSTGGQRIQEINNEYIDKREKLFPILQSIGALEPPLYKDLWEWYGVWSSGEYPTYQSRRLFVTQNISKLTDKINQLCTEVLQGVEITGGKRLDRTIREIKYRFSEAKNEEQFQAIGVLCRDSLISLAQFAYIPERHKQFSEIEPSKTDTKRMLEAFIQGELPGPSNETIRRYAKAANDLANELTHRRTATKKETIICVNATFSVINMVFALTSKSEIKEPNFV